MNIIKKPEADKIYRKEPPKVGKEFRPGEYTEYEEKLNIFQIMLRGLLKEEMEPKHYKKYDNVMFNIKVYSLTIFIAYLLFFVVLHSSLMSAPATEVYEDNWFDKMIDNTLNFLADQWENFVHNIKSL